VMPDLLAREGAILLEREITKGGRSKAAISGSRVTLAQLREVGNLLVDFHGQHEHQLLLDVRSHIDFLDGFLDLLPVRERLAAERQNLKTVAARIDALEREVAYIDKQEDFIRFEIREIDQLDLRENEDDELEAEISLLENAERVLEAGTETMDYLYDGDDAAIRNLSRAAALLERLGAYSKDLAGLGENLEQAEVLVKEVAETLRDRLGRIDLDPAHLEGLRERQAAIERIKRKYGKSVKDVLEHLKSLRHGLDNREDLAAELSGIRAERGAISNGLALLARELSDKRKAGLKSLEKAVERELRTLGLVGGNFRIILEDLEEGDDIEDGQGKKHLIGDKGMDSVEFFVRTNKGEDLLPLRKIASGGEISRVMLALKRILAEVDQVDTLVFDEVDVGIGGSLADVIGAKLREVAASRQVICITHLPQIAAHADLHVAVGKASVGGRTITEINEVEGQARVEELARMIGGKKAPESARLHAEEILKRAVAK
jgi:DNA repair protein RecN (Recombination protein N)